MNSRYVCRKVNEALKLKNTLPVINHRGGSILLWRYVAAFGLKLLRIKGIMDNEQHLAILKNNINGYEIYLWGVTVHSTGNNRYKFTRDIPTQSPDLIPIENL